MCVVFGGNFFCIVDTRIVNLLCRLGNTNALASMLTRNDACAARSGSWAELTVAPPIARACLLHLLWHRRLGDLFAPLGDGSPRRSKAAALM